MERKCSLRNEVKWSGADEKCRVRQRARAEFAQSLSEKMVRLADAGVAGGKKKAVTQLAANRQPVHVLNGNSTHDCVTANAVISMVTRQNN